MSPSEREKLDAIDRRRRREEALLLALLLVFIDRARLMSGHAMRLGTDPAQAAADVIMGSGTRLPGIVPRLAVRLATTHAEAAQTVERFTGSQPVTADVRELAQRYRPVAVEAAERITQNVRDLINTVRQYVGPDGVAPTINQIIATMRETFDARGYSPRKPATALTQAITLAASAWSAGSFAAWSRPEIWQKIQAFEFVTFRDKDGKPDEKVCPICLPLDGVTLPRDDPWWLSHWNPLHHRCRCNTRPVFGSFRVKAPPENSKPPGANFGARPDTTFGYSAFGTR